MKEMSFGIRGNRCSLSGQFMPPMHHEEIPGAHMPFFRTPFPSLSGCFGFLAGQCQEGALKDL
jgi:hypothetical protein